MNILMVTNTYLPHVGGVARSASSFRDEYRRRGHRVVVIAPEYDGPSSDEADVIRMPAIRRFYGTDFSLEVPVPGLIQSALSGFEPDIVHSHHPFLLGDPALRLARSKGVPIVFTYHTMWEHYAHYAWDHSPWLKRFLPALALGYAGLVDRVFAPSMSVARLLRENHVRTPVDVVPTGIDLKAWRSGNGARFRKTAGIPADAPVIGYLGRIAVEKNLEFLANSVARFLRGNPRSVFLAVGEGPQKRALRDIFDSTGLGNRVHWTGILTGPSLADAVHAMDALAFSSKSETQGLVLAEAMGAGVPVVALDAPGSRDIVSDGVNGRLVRAEDSKTFAAAVGWALSRKVSLRTGCLATARRYSIEAAASRALERYESLDKGGAGRTAGRTGAMAELQAEWSLVQNLTAAAARAAHEPAKDPQEAPA